MKKSKLLNIVIIVCTVSILVLLSVLMFMKGQEKEVIKEEEQTEITVTTVPEETVTPTPTPLLDVSADTADDMLERFMPFVLSPDYPYGQHVSGSNRVCEEDILFLAGIKEIGPEISVDKVTVGDVGTYGGNYCVCIGHDRDGTAIFAYASSLAYGVLSGGGIYTGYALEEKDALLCGMYPVPCEKYYDCMEGTIENKLLFELLSICEKNKPVYADSLYDLGRVISNKDAEKFMKTVPETLMVEHNVRFSATGLPVFLDNFLSHTGAEGIEGEFSLLPVSYFEIAGTIIVTAAPVSLSGDSYLISSGSWDVTAAGEKGIIPYPVFDLFDFIGFGFEQAQKKEYIYDENGDILDFNIVENTNDKYFEEDGKTYYQGAGFVVEVEENMTVIDGSYDGITRLGEYQHMVTADDGYFEVVDVSAFKELTEKEIYEELENFRDKLNSEQRSYEEEYDEDYEPDEIYPDEEYVIIDPYDGSIIETN